MLMIVEAPTIGRGFAHFASLLLEESSSTLEILRIICPPLPFQQTEHQFIPEPATDREALPHAAFQPEAELKRYPLRGDIFRVDVKREPV
jgi:hypothetical protein